MEQEQKSEMSFLEHLEELRWVIIRSLISVILMACIAFFLKDILFDHVLLAPRKPDFFSNKVLCQIAKEFHSPSLCINQSPAQLQNISMGGQFNMHIWVSIIAGFILAFPYVLYQIWSFIAPALHSNERKHARGAVLYSSALFFLGVLFGYFILLPFSIDFLTSYSVSSEVVNQINFVSYISNITTVTLACGLVFELPIVVYFLSSIGIVTPELMKKYWRHSLIVILVVAAIITPPDVVSQILVSLPLILLYWGSIFISAVVVRKKANKI